MFYGKSGVSSFQGGVAGSAWDGNYVGVWHVPNGTTLGANDSTSNGNNASAMTTPSASAGVIDGAATRASGDYIQVPNTASLQSTSLTVSFSIKTLATT